MAALLAPSASALAADHPGEHRVTGDAFIYLPVTTANIVLSLSQIAEASGINVGFEALAEETSAQQRNADKRQPSLATWPMRGLLLSEALDMLVSLDDRYGWREIDGVVNFRPTAAFNNPDHFLNTAVGTFELNHAIPIEATFAVHRLFRPECEIHHPMYGTPEQRAEFLAGLPPLEQTPITLTVHDSTVLSILNRVIRAYKSVNWIVTYDEVPATYEHSAFVFSSTLQLGGWSSPCQ